jgi:hypothetical protein
MPEPRDNEWEDEYNKALKAWKAERFGLLIRPWLWPFLLFAQIIFWGSGIALWAMRVGLVKSEHRDRRWFK